MRILLIISLLLNLFQSFCGLYLSLELKKREESEEGKHGKTEIQSRQ